MTNCFKGRASHILDLLLIYLAAFGSPVQFQVPRPHHGSSVNRFSIGPMRHSQPFQIALDQATQLIAQINHNQTQQSTFTNVDEFARWGWTLRRREGLGESFDGLPDLRIALQALNFSTLRPPNIWRSAIQNLDFETGGSPQHLAVSNASC